MKPDPRVPHTSRPDRPRGNPRRPPPSDANQRPHGREEQRPHRRAADAVEHFFATCPRGLEAALALELTALGVTDARAAEGGVAFEGTHQLAYLVNLWSRLASRVLWQVGFGRYRDQQDIYDAALKVNWPHWFAVRNTMRVNVTAVRSPLTSIDFITLKIKDAVCDRFRNATGERPSIDTAAPDIRVHAFITSDTCTFYLDTSGDALFKRGYRVQPGEAPLRENLAAGLLHIAGWTPAQPLLDPFCGSGTILIEAAMIAADIAPGLERGFGFRHLSWFDPDAWSVLREAARQRADAGRRDARAQIRGSDVAEGAVVSARAAATAAGVASLIDFRRADALTVPGPDPSPDPATAASGIIVTNPPYGVRIGEADDLRALYAAFADTLKRNFAGWNAWILCGEMSLMKAIRLSPSRKVPLFNGAIECRLVEYRLVTGSNRKLFAPSTPAAAATT